MFDVLSLVFGRNVTPKNRWWLMWVGIWFTIFIEGWAYVRLFNGSASWTIPQSGFIGMAVLVGLYTITTFIYMPRFAEVATDTSLGYLQLFGAFYYLLTGSLISQMVPWSIAPGAPIPPSTACLVVFALVLNSWVINHGIVEWNRRKAAQKDIGKLVFRSPVLVTLGLVGAQLGSDQIAQLATFGASILLIPTSFEVLLIIRKTPVDPHPEATPAAPTRGDRRSRPSQNARRKPKKP